jgi:saccharopine dehydrogenase-like NADP-dependent oxidoreductase
VLGIGDVVFIGLGRVGFRTLKLFKELVRDVHVYVVDSNPNVGNLISCLSDVEFYLYKPEVINELVRKADLVVTALPSNTAFNIVSDLVRRCVDVVDVSFFSEDPYILEDVVKGCNSTFVPDAGFAPGYTNLVVGYGINLLGNVDSVEVFVGGIPSKPIPPLGYVITWNPLDLIEEYVRPARVVEDFKIKFVDPLETIVDVDLGGLGRFEGFVSDGLRTLLRNVRVRNMREVTIRWSNHLSKMKFLRDIGLMSKELIRVGDVAVRPAEVLAKLLEMYLPKEAEDIAIAYVVVRGGREYSELAVLRGSPEEPATPTFTALVHAYTAKLVYEGRVGSGIQPLEKLVEFKGGYEDYLRSKGVSITSRLR